MRCPAGVEMDFEAGGVVRFPKKTCAACPLRERCTKSKSARPERHHPPRRAASGGVERASEDIGGEAKLRERVGWSIR